MSETKIRIVVFAGLKDFFESKIEIDHSFLTIQEVFHHLVVLNPKAEELLKKCRFAVSNTFVDVQFSLNGINEVLVLPPSSGG